MSIELRSKCTSSPFKKSQMIVTISSKNKIDTFHNEERNIDYSRKVH